MSEHKAAMQKSLWAVANKLRGQMDGSDYQKYMLGVIFYKYLSDITERKVYELVDDEDKNRTISDILEDPDYEGLEEDVQESLGFSIHPSYLYSALLSEIDKRGRGNWSTDLLQKAFNSVIESTQGTKSQETFDGLFEDIKLDSTGLGSTITERNNTMGGILQDIGKIDFHLDDVSVDVLGDAYEYLIGSFAENAGKKGGEFYTPQSVSTLVSRILAHENPEMLNVYDPTCGSGSLLMRVAKESEQRTELISLYGQERNFTTYNLARMNMILHGVKWDNFKIENGDTLKNDKFPDKSFDAIAANPPYSLEWEHTPEMSDDVRFRDVGKLAPKNKADFAFVQHIVHHLNEDGGVAAIVLPHGVLFRGSSEAMIRQHLLEQNLVHAVIGLPENLFYGTGIPTTILVIKKGRAEDEGILFIDASQGFIKEGNKNKLDKDSMERLFAAYTGFEDVDKYARVVSMDEIKENEYNLNITRYVDITEDEELLDLKAIQDEIGNIKGRLVEIESNMQEYIVDLYPVES